MVAVRWIFWADGICTPSKDGCGTYVGEDEDGTGRVDRHGRGEEVAALLDEHADREAHRQLEDALDVVLVQLHGPAVDEVEHELEGAHVRVAQHHAALLALAHPGAEHGPQGLREGRHPAAVRGEGAALHQEGHVAVRVAVSGWGGVGSAMGLFGRQSGRIAPAYPITPPCSHTCVQACTHLWYCWRSAQEQRARPRSPSITWRVKGLSPLAARAPAVAASSPASSAERNGWPLR